MGHSMGKSKCLSNLKPGHAFSAALLIGLVFLLTASGLPSTADYDGIYLELVTTGSDNWTQSGSNEEINFSINNTNASLSINQVNISMPLLADGNASFAVYMGTVFINSSWDCYSITSDGLGNVTLIECNTSSAYLTEGSDIAIGFCADASSTSTEDLYQWNITMLNETNSYVVSQNISSGVDGLAPRISDFGVNGTYFTTGDTIKIWANVTDASLNETGVGVTILNASNTSEVLPGPAPPDMDCSHLNAYSWNCTLSLPIYPGPETDANVTFNVTPEDKVGYSSESTYTGWFFIDVTAPAVTLNYPVNGGWYADGDVEFNFTPYDSSLSLVNCSVWVANSTGGEWALNDTKNAPVNNQMNNITVYGFSTDSDQQVQYIWNVRCWDQVANSSFASQNFTVNVGNRSNIIVESVTFDETEAPYENKFVTVNVTLKNNGTANVMNTTNIRVYFDDDDNPQDDPLYSNSTVQVQNTSLPYGGTHSVLYEFNTSSGDGVYYALACADSGSDEGEQYDDDNSKQNSFSTFLNVTVNDVSGSPVNATQNVTVSVTVRYNNGTNLTGLTIDDFSIYDRWVALDRLRTETDPLPNTTLGGFSETGDGIYTFNYTVPGPQLYSDEISEDEEWYTARYAEYGTHYINVMASLTDDSGSTGNYTGNSSYTGSYNLTAPYLRLDVTSFNEDMTVGDTDESHYIFYNDGNVPIPSGAVSVESDESDTDIIDFDFLNTADDDEYTILVELAPGGGSNQTDGNMDAEAEGTANLTVNGSYTYGGQHYSYLETIQVVVSVEGDGNGDGDDNGGTTTTSGIQYDCITDADCDSDEECDSDFMCVEIECEEGYYATGHTCKIKPVFEIEITEYESDLSVTQGESVVTVVQVNNTGNENLTAMLTVEMELENVSFNVTPPAAGVDAGKTGNFTISFNVSEAARVGKHPLSYKLTTSSIAKDTENFILSIQPLPEAVEEIKLSYQNYTAIVAQILAEFNAGKSRLSGENLTAMETKINYTETLFNSLKEAMENEDYAQAATYIDELSSLIASTRTLMEEFGISGSSSDFWNNVMIWIVVIFVCIGAAGLLIYMMLPAKGYALGKGYAPGGGGITDRLKEMMQTIKEKTSTGKVSSAGQIVKKYKPAYSSGYSKLGGGYKPPSRSMGEKMKKALRKEK